MSEPRRRVHRESPGPSLGDVARVLLPFAGALAFFEYTLHRQRGPSKAALERSPTSKAQRVTFADVAGNAAAKVELAEIVDILRNPKPYMQLGARCPSGILLVGPPGTGKTLLARAAAGEANVPFFSLSASALVEMYVGMGAKRVRETFADCRATGGPSLLFIDEIDAVGGARGRAGSISEHDQTLNELLVQMDGFSQRKTAPVVVIGATNRADTLDPALLRAGRFDRVVTVDLPRTVADRLAILKVYARKVQLGQGVDLGAVAAATEGLSGATLANLINEAALLAARKRAPQVTQAELVEAVARVREAERAAAVDQRAAWRERKP